MESPFAHLTSELGAQLFFGGVGKYCRTGQRWVHLLFILFTSCSYDVDSDDSNGDGDKGDSQILFYEFGLQGE